MNGVRVRTALGRAVFDTVLLRGFDVMKELCDDGYWSVVSVALGNRRLTREECRVIDALAVLTGIGDPRIWPLKMTRLVGSYGRSFAAISVAFTLLDDAPLGALPPRAAAELFVGAAQRSKTPADDAVNIAAMLDETLEAGKMVPAFGVAGREHDERNTTFHEWYRQNVQTPGRYYTLYLAAVDHMERQHGLKPNFAGPTASIALDFGFEPANIPELISFFLYWAFAANALESRRESPEILRKLPADVVNYVGPPPRQSPRALAAQEG